MMTLAKDHFILGFNVQHQQGFLMIYMMVILIKEFQLWKCQNQNKVIQWHEQ